MILYLWYNTYDTILDFQLQLGAENIEKKDDSNKDSEEVINIESTAAKGSGNEIKLDVSPQVSSLSRQLSFSNRIVMNQLENPRELGNLPNLTSLPKYQLETASKITGANLSPNADLEISSLELEAKRHQQIHMLIKLAR